MDIGLLFCLSCFFVDAEPGTYCNPCGTACSLPELDCVAASIGSPVSSGGGLKHTNSGIRCLEILSLCNLCLNIDRVEGIGGGCSTT